MLLQFQKNKESDIIRDVSADAGLLNHIDKVELDNENGPFSNSLSNEKEYNFANINYHSGQINENDSNVMDFIEDNERNVKYDEIQLHKRTLVKEKILKHITGSKVN